jgi:hypothetical protein
MLHAAATAACCGLENALGGSVIVYGARVDALRRFARALRLGVA